MTESDRTSPPSRTQETSESVRDGGKDEEKVLPDTTRDERDVGWGDESSRRDDEWYRRERPPHHA